MTLSAASPAAMILALNPGSSSVKAAVRAPEPVFSLTLERIGDGGSEVGGGRYRRRAALRDRGLRPDVVSHRVVHGSPRHHEPTEIDDTLLAGLRTAIPLAPLHLPAGLDTIGHVRRAWPTARHVACFDTGFHHTLPSWSRRLPVAAELEVLVRSAAAAIAACASHLDGGTLVFTGGVGAHSPPIRDRIRARLRPLTPGGLRVLAVEPDEESELDRAARRMLAQG